jgi:hypothetical protein
MLTHNFTYAATLNDAIKVNWTVNDLIGGDKRLDFSYRVFPDSLAVV